MQTAASPADLPVPPPPGAPRPGLRDLIAAEAAHFAATHPKAMAHAAQAGAVWRGGAPLHWMADWASPAPIVAERGKGARLHDIDGHAYDDFCLGDSPAMFGHGPPALARAVADQAARGAAFMLPTAASLNVGRLLAERFGLPLWQATTTASEANRAALRWARAVTGREGLIVFDGCYHGAVDETFVSLESGAPAPRRGLVGQRIEAAAATRVIPFNDLAALGAALASGGIAAVLAEPVMTNCGMILPQPGFHEALRCLTREHGALLILDETHTLSSGPGGYTRAHALEPDMLVVGKAIAGGVPAAVWGVTADLALRMDEAARRIGQGYSGVGTTLSGSALALAAMEAMLGEVMSEEAYGRMREGADRLVGGLEGVIAQRGLPWSVVRAGARVELVLAQSPPQNAAQMRLALDRERLAGLHLHLINRGVLIAPFHNMMLVSPMTETAQIDRLIRAVEGFAQALEGCAA